MYNVLFYYQDCVAILGIFETEELAKQCIQEDLSSIKEEDRDNFKRYYYINHVELNKKIRLEF